MIPLYWTRAPYTAKPLSQNDLYKYLINDDEVTFKRLCEFVGKLGMPIHCYDVIQSFSGNDHEAYLGELWV